MKNHITPPEVTGMDLKYIVYKELFDAILNIANPEERNEHLESLLTVFRNDQYLLKLAELYFNLRNPEKLEKLAGIEFAILGELNNSDGHDLKVMTIQEKEQVLHESAVNHYGSSVYGACLINLKCLTTYLRLNPSTQEKNYNLTA